MTRKQLIWVYAVVVFMSLWGFDLINLLKFNRALTLDRILHPFIFSELVYVTGSLLLTRFIFRRYYTKRRYLGLAFALLLMILLFIAVRYSLEEILYRVAFGFGNYREGVSLKYYALDNIYYVILYMAFGTLIFFLDHQLETQKKQSAMLQRSREAELQFLRSQINPHFMFNTLNNIYTLVYEKSDKAPDAVLRLSELMRYLLYESREKVSVLQEWEYVQSFISLQRLRFYQDIHIKTKLEGDLASCQIIPHLLIGFVENAFKHGELKDPKDPLHLTLHCNETQILFQMKNKIAKQQKDKTGGVGLENIRRRLELVYPDRHQLHISDDGEHFALSLMLNLQLP